MKQLPSLPQYVLQLLASLIRAREEGKPRLANLMKSWLESRAKKLDIPVESVYSYYGNIDDAAQRKVIYHKLGIVTKYRPGNRRIA